MQGKIVRRTVRERNIEIGRNGNWDSDSALGSNIVT
jgi:hypothetical protein